MTQRKQKGAATSRATSPLKWHGGKHYLAKRINALKPPHRTWCITHAGGLSELMESDPEGISEVVNDINEDITNFWRVLQDEESFARFCRSVEAVPFSESHFDFARDFVGRDWIEKAMNSAVFRAVEFFICCRQSLAGRMKSFAPISKSRTRRGMNEQVSAWLSAIEGLPAVHERLKRVLILNRDALEVIRMMDHADTLYYCDPPYAHETRVSTDDYAHEMTLAQHEDLLKTLAGIQGKFLLSGYRSALYDDYAARHNWRRVEFELPNNAAGGRQKRTMVECVWMNYPESV